MKTYPYDLSHYTFQASKIGYLNTLGYLPIVAGDVVDLDLTGVFRLSPLRRQLVVDAKVDIFAFYVPYRHIYGSDWVDFIKGGKDEGVTFTGVDLGTDPHSWMGHVTDNTVPKWMVAGYNRIWNRYFRHPTADGDIKSDTDIPSTLHDRMYGWPVGFLPAIWNTPIDGEIDTSDYQVGSVATVDIRELSEQRMRLKTEIRREWYGQRYNDILARTYGTSVNIDADERPELLMRNSFWMSGYDVDGTDSATLGQYSGKGAAIGQFRVPRRRFAEHGTLWLMAVCRFPPINEQEHHYLAKKANPTYEEIAGDPDIMAGEIPHTVDLDDYMWPNSGAVADAGTAPFGQWYRYQPNFVHRRYDYMDGFAFVITPPTTKAAARYHAKDTYKQCFQTSQLGQWQAHARVNVLAERVVPPVEASIFVGATE